MRHFLPLANYELSMESLGNTEYRLAMEFLSYHHLRCFRVVARIIFVIKHGSPPESQRPMRR